MAITISGTNITMDDSSTITSTTTYGAIGSYAQWWNIQTSAISRGSTIAGTSLRSTTTLNSIAGSVPSGHALSYASMSISVVSSDMSLGLNSPSGSGQFAGLPGGASGSGTWRNMNPFGIGGATYNPNEGQNNLAAGGLFARIS